LKEEVPSLRNITKEVFSPGYLDRAQERRKAKTIWDLAFLPVGFGLIGMVWYGFYRGFLSLHLLIYPQNADHLVQLMDGPDRLPPLLMTVPLFFPAIPIGFILMNVLMWLIPEVRADSEAKATGVKWANYRQAQTALFVVAVFLMIPAIIAGAIGAYLLGRP